MSLWTLGDRAKEVPWTEAWVPGAKQIERLLNIQSPDPGAPGCSVLSSEQSTTDPFNENIKMQTIFMGMVSADGYVLSPGSGMRSGLFPLVLGSPFSLRRVLCCSVALTNLALWRLPLEHRARRMRPIRTIIRTRTEMMARKIHTMGVTLIAWIVMKS